MSMTTRHGESTETRLETDPITQRLATGVIVACEAKTQEGLVSSLSSAKVIIIARHGHNLWRYMDWTESNCREDGNVQRDKIKWYLFLQ